MNEREEFEQFRRKNDAILNRFIGLIESRKRPGEIDESIEQFIIAATESDSKENIKELQRFARASRFVKAAWLFIGGGVVTVGSFILWGRDILMAVRDFLDLWVRAHPPAH